MRSGHYSIFSAWLPPGHVSQRRSPESPESEFQPVGRAKTDPDGDEFQTLTDVVLSPSGITVEMEAIEEGPVEADAGSLTRIVTIISGWETITNPSPASVGIARQSDEDFRAAYLVRTAHSSIGPMSGLAGALEESAALKTKITENNTTATVVTQEWSIYAHSLLVVAESGSDGDVSRSIENHRGMGAGTMTAINGGIPNETTLGLIGNGTVTWNGVDYTGLNLIPTVTPAERATELTTLLVGTGVTVSYIDGRYVAIYAWMPGLTPNFGNGTTEVAFGLDANSNDYPEGPFIRPRQSALTVSLTLTRVAGFPADGLQMVRNNILNRVRTYSIGEQLWNNDLLCESERVAGTRISAFTVQYNGASISGVAVPLDNLWTLASTALTVTVA